MGDTERWVEGTVDGDGRRKRSKAGFLAAEAAGGTGNRKFACPYFKRNPRKYRKWTSCPGPGWDEVHRVKTHLYRRHQLPIQCPRCWEVFKADSALQSHLQQDPPCAMQEKGTLYEGFTKDQEKRLRSRKKTHPGMTDEDKWREIFMILFPDDDPNSVPSPYYSEAEDEGEGGSLHGAGELEDYATFIRREMPTLVRRELEALFRHEFQDIEERIRPRVAEIVLNLQPRLLSLYKQSQTPLSEYGPEQPGVTSSGGELSLAPLLSDGSCAATGTSSTPSTTLRADNWFSEPKAQLGLHGSGLDSDWVANDAEHWDLIQVQGTDSSLGLDWDFEFDNLLNPALFMPPSEEMQPGSAGEMPA
ncbi:uncharacterized protein THITE_127193 [Thermothielavioides terrestris NRRL 8126]|uniref:C2H2-type domain-containing protein n=1 Tax=Thermothielavioides terrestris (strain ATCC 38088 / NRRL 8126) TaxID=578455 RepID=G2REK6_THETT|nr:uncharacterized protein THITE_127193 [Thermothielavioides terrestris NRRL 8126]AEO70981.1 hypothetical protein THITE_127193 [Thermothielavioides terrestris NRRL 8126]